MDDIAYSHGSVKPQFQRVSAAFQRLSRLVLSAFFCTPEGTKDLGYIGNVPINGDYPGPTKEALEHLDGILDDLGLSEYAFKEDLN